MNILREYSATISLAILASILVIGWFSANSREDYENDSAIRALMKFPAQLGDADGIWISTRDVQVPSSQERILELSSFVSREFRRLGTHPAVKATLFIAYCADARTMVGHHPPHCYPASGWAMRDEETKTSSVLRDDQYSVNYSVYRFRRDQSREPLLVVVNGFFSRPGIFTATLNEWTESVDSVFFGHKGLFQFQILFQGLESEVDVSRYSEELLRGIPSSVFDLAFGRENDEILVRENARGAES